MYFKSVELNNFRNYKEEKIDFHPKLNLFLGCNAQGKTNLLESLFIMGLGKSFRTNNDKEMINFNSESSLVKTSVIDDYGDETNIEISYMQDGKIIKVNGIKLDRTAELLENVYIVIFSPEDLKIIKEGPENRRRFLDRELCQIKPVYYSDLGNYKKVLKERNNLLRQQNRDMNLYSVFDEALADYGIRIINERKKFIERLQIISEKIQNDISGGSEKLELKYEYKTDDKEDYKNILVKNFETDFIKGHTGFGPHKDDICIKVNGIDIRNYGSQGQQRTAALSMKLAEIGLIKQETGKNAVLLLDDVLSELDKNRQRYLIESMRNVQVFITGTEIDNEVLNLLPEGEAFHIDTAKLYKYNIKANV